MLRDSLLATATYRPAEALAADEGGLRGSGALTAERMGGVAQRKQHGQVL